MQPHTDRPTTSTVPQRGDEADLYRRHHQALLIAVSQAINGSAALIEDACQSAWTILVRRQPNRASVFAWLYVVAIHEAYRLSAIERRELHLEDLAIEGDWETILAGRVTVEDQLEALEALSALAGLPNSQRRDLTLRVAGFTYREIAAMTGGRTYTNVNKHLVKAAPASAAPTPHESGAKHPFPNSSWANGRPRHNPAYPRTEHAMSYLTVELDQLTPAERRDLANALLRAAWSAVLRETRVALLDLLVEVDDAVLGDAT